MILEQYIGRWVTWWFKTKPTTPAAPPTCLEFRAMLRRVFVEPNISRDYELRLLSYQYALATRKQQLACSAAVATDIAEAEETDNA